MSKVEDNYSDLEMSDDDCEKTELDLTFNKAANHLKNFVSKLDSSTLLKFYAHFKQATEGKCNVPRPSWYDIQGKQKWEAWNSLGDLNSVMAKKIYIDLMIKVDESFNKHSEKVSGPNNSESWVSVSRMIKASVDLDEKEKTVFHWCQENDIQFVNEALNENPSLANTLDENGLGLIHWASDRGYAEMLLLLISHKSNVNFPDYSGQTALHYAVSCGHTECVKILLENGALCDVKDSEGLKPIDLCNDGTMQQFLSNFLSIY